METTSETQEILSEIETLNGISLTLISIQEMIDDISIELDKPCYSINKNGEIIAFDFWGAEVLNLNPLKKLRGLVYLSLHNCTLKDVSVLIKIFPIKTLKYLYISDVGIKDLMFLSEETNLKTLSIWNNPIVEYSVLNKLKKIKHLYLNSTGINDLSFVLNMPKLTHLGANGNNISCIDEIASLKKISYLDLSFNNIKYIDKKIASKTNWLHNTLFYDEKFGGTGSISLYGNDLEFPPESVITLGSDCVKNYYEASEEYGHSQLSEGRIIVIGDGSSGKSSLIERLLYDTYEPGKSQTNGIKIEKWTISPLGNRDLTFHIWDFGGQEIQHAVHKFFFTQGCLYILVLDNRKEEEPEYWLQQIESLGAGAPVVVVFNKQDQNTIDTVDRKYLRKKYPNIINFYNTSCKTGEGIVQLRSILKTHSAKLKTVDEQFPINWFNIKKSIEVLTSGDKHYLDFSSYSAICTEHNVADSVTQKLLLQYFTTIGSVTWFGDTYLNFLHVLSPTWITQGVYKIITSPYTSKKKGIINISDFKKLLAPTSPEDYLYEENYFSYILSVMKKFDLCYTPDDNIILIPSCFGKEPKIEYSDFLGETIRTYILQFKEYMPVALIHRIIAKKLSYAFDNNYWYSGIVIADSKMGESLTMIHSDKSAKRIYIKIKGYSPLGMWEHIRREFEEISKSYGKIIYDELVSLDERSENVVRYEDLISHIKANKSTYFHAQLQKDFNVGYLIGLFETKSDTIQRLSQGIITYHDQEVIVAGEKPTIQPFVINILNQNSPTIAPVIRNEVNLNIQIINNIASGVKGDAAFLYDEVSENQNELRSALETIKKFAEDVKSIRKKDEIKEKGWGRKLKNALNTLSSAGEVLSNIKGGGEALKSMYDGIKDLAQQFDLSQISDMLQGF